MGLTLRLILNIFGILFKDLPGEIFVTAIRYEEKYPLTNKVNPHVMLSSCQKSAKLQESITKLPEIISSLENCVVLFYQLEILHCCLFLT